MSLPIAWYGELKKDEDKKKLEEVIRHSTVALGRLKEIVEGNISSSERQETRMSEYDSASWSHKQAHRNGYRQAMFEMKELLSFLDQRR